MENIHTRINHKESFELCYLRHQYLKKVKYSPKKEELDNYTKIVDNFSRNTFYVYKNLFLLVGLDLEDVVNISQIHLISFLGLFALERDVAKLNEFKQKFKGLNSIKCTKEDILNKNKANFTCFLKQRLEDVVRVCRQKAKNVKGLLAEEFSVFRGTKKPPSDIEDLFLNHKKYGYNPVGTSVFKTIKKRMVSKQDGPVYLHNNVWYVCVPLRKKKLELIDFACNNVDPYSNIHNMTPEEVLEMKESSSTYEEDDSDLKSMSSYDKKRIIKNFIKHREDVLETIEIKLNILKNNGSKVKETHIKQHSALKEELKTAKQFLERLDGRNI